MSIIHKTLEVKYQNTLYFKCTVEELKNGTFISTLWITEDCYEVDRTVESHETYSYALSEMYRKALMELNAFTDLLLIVE